MRVIGGVVIGRLSFKCVRVASWAKFLRLTVAVREWASRFVRSVVECASPRRPLPSAAIRIWCAARNRPIGQTPVRLWATSRPTLPAYKHPFVFRYSAPFLSTQLGTATVVVCSEYSTWMSWCERPELWMLLPRALSAAGGTGLRGGVKLNLLLLLLLSDCCCCCCCWTRTERTKVARSVDGFTERHWPARDLYRLETPSDCISNNSNDNDKKKKKKKKLRLEIE